MMYSKLKVFLLYDYCTSWIQAGMFKMQEEIKKFKLYTKLSNTSLIT